MNKLPSEFQKPELINYLNTLDKPAPLEDPQTGHIGDFFENPPPPRPYLLDAVLPAGIVGAVVAGGGTGKSFLALQLGVSLATGLPFLGITTPQPRGVLILASEDTREEIWRRMWAIFEQTKRDILGPIAQSGPEWDEIQAQLKQRLFIFSRTGKDSRLIAEVDRALVPTGVGGQIVELADQLPADIGLIILDPLSRFRSGSENDNSAMTLLVEQMESIRDQTGATVLAAHHVNKAALTMNEPGQLAMDSLRGGSAFADGLRWIAGLATLRKDQARLFGLAKNEAWRYVCFGTLKNSYGPELEGIWLKRGCAGVLQRVEMSEARQEQKEEKAEQTHRRVVTRVRQLIRERGPLSARELRLNWAGAAGPLRLSEKPLRGILTRAVLEGDLTERLAPAGTGKLLYLPGGEDNA